MNGTRINYSGLVVAGVGFFLTRFTVTLAIYEDPIRFYLAGIVPLVLGLGLAAFGVALTVADVERSLVRTTALWCVTGAGTMLALVLLTLLASQSQAEPTIRSQTYLSNFLIGGSIGGTLTGLYAARNRQQRSELASQADRLEVLNRFLRHEVLNAVTAIRGYAAIRDDGQRDAETVIDEHSDSIEQTIEEVKYLTRTARTNETALGSLELSTCLSESVKTVRERHPDTDIHVDGTGGETYVRATDRLERVFSHLLENAIVHTGDDPEPIEVSVQETVDTVRVSVEDDGPGLPEDQRELLETGAIDTYDDPGTGFGLNMVRFLVDSFDGSIETTVTDNGSTVTIVLPQEGDVQTGLEPDRSRLMGVRPSLPHLLVILVASVLAGIPYGIVSELMGRPISGIGTFYGTVDPVVGWITHEFHSVVFGFVFAGLISIAAGRYRDSLPAYVAVGIGWGLTVWIVAAGIVAPIWLRLIGIPAPIPNLTVHFLATHLAWGVTLGILTGLGYRYVTPWLQRRGL